MPLRTVDFCMLAARQQQNGADEWSDYGIPFTRDRENRSMDPGTRDSLTDRMMDYPIRQTNDLQSPFWKWRVFLRL